MSVPFYYKDGQKASATMRADLHMVRQLNTERLGNPFVTEERTVEGKKTTVRVRRVPDSLPMSGRARHDLWTSKRTRSDRW